MGARHDLLGPRFEGAAAEAQLGAQEASDQQPLAPPPVREPRDPCREHARRKAEQDLARLRVGVRARVRVGVGVGVGVRVRGCYLEGDAHVGDVICVKEPAQLPVGDIGEI